MRCQSCGLENPAEARFCGTCGRSLLSVAAATSTPRQQLQQPADSRSHRSGNLIAVLTCPVCGANANPDDDRCAYCGSFMVILSDLPRINPHNLNTQVINTRIAKFRDAIRADELDQSAYYGLGVAYFNLGLHQDAARELETAARLMPENPHIQTQLAAVYEKLSVDDPAYLEDAADRVERALLLRPELSEALVIRSKLFLHQGAYDSAVHVWRSLRESDPDALRCSVAEFLTQYGNMIRTAPQLRVDSGRSRSVRKADSGSLAGVLRAIRRPRYAALVSAVSFVIFLIIVSTTVDDSGDQGSIAASFMLVCFFAWIVFGIYFFWRLWKSRQERPPRHRAIGCTNAADAGGRSHVHTRTARGLLRTLFDGSAHPDDLLGAASWLATQLAPADEQVRMERRQRELDEARRQEMAEHQRLVTAIEAAIRSARNWPGHGRDRCPLIKGGAGGNTDASSAICRARWLCGLVGSVPVNSVIWRNR